MGHDKVAEDEVDSADAEPVHGIFSIAGGDDAITTAGFKEEFAHGESLFVVVDAEDGFLWSHYFFSLAFPAQVREDGGEVRSMKGARPSAGYRCRDPRPGFCVRAWVATKRATLRARQDAGCGGTERMAGGSLVARAGSEWSRNDGERRGACASALPFQLVVAQATAGSSEIDRNVPFETPRQSTNVKLR
jgi:hypothetical protein